VKPRAVVDTSAWIKAVRSRQGWGRALLNAYADGRFLAVISEPALAELAAVLARPAHRRTAAMRTAGEALLAALRAGAEFVPITGQVRLCRDPNDDVFLETALLGRADYLVSTDADLLSMTVPGLTILPPAAFFRWLPPAP
jgi:putative PIN family toxin of toxin-antitoxin system